MTIRANVTPSHPDVLERVQHIIGIARKLLVDDGLLHERVRVLRAELAELERVVGPDWDYGPHEITSPADYYFRRDRVSGRVQWYDDATRSWEDVLAEHWPYEERAS